MTHQRHPLSHPDPKDFKLARTCQRRQPSVLPIPRRLATTMLFPKRLAVPLIFLTLAAAQNSTNCPELPETGVTMGEPVPMHPEHIPAGCSDFEILVGEYS